MKKIFAVVFALACTAAMSVTAMASTPSVVTEIFSGINLTTVFQDLATAIGGQVTALIPIGIGIIFILAIPRIIRRLVNTFI